ncbi:hypothetical protein AB1Y20_006424 [Prymnesium parvum]|uniref:Kinesin motor domain-containing protein n=1 Tax=Prymnesium parvum TaxID=97485 RepID=A0AB34J2M0_PRYPA
MDSRQRRPPHAPPRAAVSPLRRATSTPSKLRSTSPLDATSASARLTPPRERRVVSRRSPAQCSRTAPPCSRSAQALHAATTHAGGASACESSELSRGGAGAFRQSNVKVAVRCKPMSSDELSSGETPAILVHGQTVSLSHADGEPHVFAFDHAFGPATDQRSVFTACAAPLVEQLLDGFNATIFAYGQTGSGKTHTMMGSTDDPGIIPRVAFLLFDRMQSTAAAREFSVRATYLQVYNESLYDMLDSEVQSRDLKIRASPQRGVFVHGLSEHEVRCSDDVIDLIERGNRSRATSATKMNAASSRSHAVFTLFVTQDIEESVHASVEGTSLQIEDYDDSLAGGDEEGVADSASVAPMRSHLTRVARRMASKINLVDLAGSERAKLSGADEDSGLMRELVNINRSLSALGNVIAALSDGRATHVPYRDSRLTQLLEESLGGNSATVMITAVSSRAAHAAESLSTLQYAKRAQAIINVSVQGTHTADVSDAMERMAAIAHAQKVAAAEAQQAARGRQAELQAEVERVRAEAEARLAEEQRRAQRREAELQAQLQEASAGRRAEGGEAVRARLAEAEARAAVATRLETELAEAVAELEVVKHRLLRSELDASRRQQLTAREVGQLATLRGERMRLAVELTNGGAREQQLQQQLQQQALEAKENERQLRQLRSEAAAAREAAALAARDEAVVAELRARLAELEGTGARCARAEREKDEAVRQAEAAAREAKHSESAHAAEREARLRLETELQHAKDEAQRAVSSAAESAAKAEGSRQAHAAMQQMAEMQRRHEEEMRVQSAQSDKPVNELRAELARCKSDLQQQQAEVLRLNVANAKLQYDLEAAHAAREREAEHARDAQQRFMELSAQLGDLRGELDACKSARSRVSEEETSKRERREDWHKERCELIRSLAAETKRRDKAAAAEAERSSGPLDATLFEAGAMGNHVEIAHAASVLDSAGGLPQPRPTGEELKSNGPVAVKAHQLPSPSLWNLPPAVTLGSPHSSDARDSLSGSRSTVPNSFLQASGMMSSTDDESDED